jgi:hypothetical protein
MEYRIFVQILSIPVASGAVSRALHATDLGALYPRTIEVEPVETKQAVAA